MNYLGKFFRILLALALLVLLFVACRMAVMFFGWPARWTAWLFLALVFGYGFLRWGLYRFRRFREERRAQRMLEVDHAGRGAPSGDPEAAARMHLTWKSGLSFLGSSRLGRFGSAYALPWYLSMSLSDATGDADIVGPAGVQGASPVDIVDSPEFKWVFARKAVWLDLDLGKKAASETHWPLFLRELVANRGKAPLGGVAVVLDAGELLKMSDAALRAKATDLRLRLDLLIKVMGSRIPVYLLVNRIDELYGVRSLAGALSSGELEKPFGAFRTDEREVPGQFASRTLTECVLALVDAARANRRETPGVVRFGAERPVSPGEAAAVQAPAEMRRLDGPLSLFCREAFSDNPYQMVPFLRGVFFGSTGPEGATLPPHVGDLPGFEMESEGNAPAGRWFWRELVEERIPADPAPLRAVRQRRHVRAVTVHTGLAALLLCTLPVCWLMTHSFHENRSVLRAVSGNVKPPETRAGLKGYLDLALAVDKARSGWWFPRMGMREADNLAEEMKKRFCDAYLEHELNPELEKLALEIQNIGDEKDPKAIGGTILMLRVLREALETRLEMRSDGVANEHDAAVVQTLLNAMHMDSPDDRLKMQSYLRWMDPESYELGVEELMHSEHQVLTTAMDGDAMRWLPSWVEGLSRMRPVDLGNVWAPLVLPPAAESKRYLSAAWTNEGYRLAEDILDADDIPPSDRSAWAVRRMQILKQYRDAALTAWRNASLDIWTIGRAATDDASLTVLVRQAAQADDPAIRMLRKMKANLLPMFPPDDKTPEIQWLRYYDQVVGVVRPSLWASRAPEEETPGLLVKLRGTITGVANRLQSDAGVGLLARNLGISAGGDFTTALEQFQRFMGNVGILDDLSLSRDVCVETVRRQYLNEGNPSVGTAAELSASGEKPKNGVSPVPPADEGDPFRGAGRSAANVEAALYSLTGSSAWKNLSPLASYHYLRYLLTRLSAVYLDGTWFTTVYNPAQMTTGAADEVRQKLTGPGGLIDAFMTGPAKGFWRRQNQKMANASWDGINYRFSPEFLAYCDRIVELSRVKEPDKINLGFRVDAVSVNREAKERPHTATFVMREAGAEDQALVYQNYNVATSFQWNMDRNAEMTIRMLFPSLSLEKTYSGVGALGEFVKAFDRGALTLTPEDFPDSAEAMRRLGVEKISVRVTMNNQQALLRFMYEAVPELPRSIIVTRSRNLSAPLDSDGNGESARDEFAEPFL